MEFKENLNQYVSERKVTMPAFSGFSEANRCVRCLNFVKVYSGTYFHHPDVCDGCMRILQCRWEKERTLEKVSPGQK